MRHACLAVVIIAFSACSSPQNASSPASSPSPAASTPSASTPATAAAQPSLPKDDEPLPPVPSPYDALPEASRRVIDDVFMGDLDQMIKRRLVRAGVVFNRTQYFIDRGLQRGIAYEAIQQFEKVLNARLKTGHLKVHVAAVPLLRDQLFPALLHGKVDMIIGGLTSTPERRKVADFSTPTRRKVSEVVVTASEAPAPSTADDLSGREVFVRRSSSYYESLQTLNASLAARGKPPVTVKEAPEPLEDDDILEMVNAGLVDATVVDDYIAELWQHVFPALRINKTATLRTDAELGVGVRKGNPLMLRVVNVFLKEYGPRTAFGNTMKRRYFESPDYVKDAASEQERRKFQALVKMFEQYAKQYNVDYLLMAAQGYQESRLDQRVKSQVGAIGVMQVMPATAKDLAVGDISQVGPNIHAGVKYFRFMMDTYYKDEPMDDLNKGLMTLASYNAGPGRIRQLRRETERRGLNPNLWFGNVERVVSEKVGRETVQYVGNIYKYYVAYRLVLDRATARDAAKAAVPAK